MKIARFLPKNKVDVSQYMRLMDEFLPHQTVRSFGLILAGLGIVFIIIGVLCFLQTSQYNHSLDSVQKIQKEECVQKLQGYGFRIETDGNNIHAKLENLQQGLQAITMASAAAIACPGWQLVDFCAGEACGTPPVQLTLSNKPVPTASVIKPAQK